jgi:hypothetical protein
MQLGSSFIQIKTWHRLSQLEKFTIMKEFGMEQDTVKENKSTRFLALIYGLLLCKTVHVYGFSSFLARKKSQLSILSVRI